MTGEPEPAAPARGFGNTLAFALLALAAVILAYFGFFAAILLIGFAFDAPGSGWTDSGLWLRVLVLGIPTLFCVVALASLVAAIWGRTRYLAISFGLLGLNIALLVAAVAIATGYE